MYPVSEAYLRSVCGRERRFPVRCKFSGLDEYVTKKHIRTGSYTDIIDGNSVISMGNACAKKVAFVVQDFKQVIVWKDHLFTMEKGLVVDGVTEWVPWGTFWVTDAVTSNNNRTINVTAYDYMYKLSKMKYETALEAPFHYRDLLNEFLENTGLTLSTTLELPSAADEDYIVLSWPEGDFSYSDIAGHLAGMVGGNARICITDPSVIEFVWYTPTQTIIKETLYQDGFEKLADGPLRVDYFVVGDNEIRNDDDSNAGEIFFDDYEEEEPDLSMLTFTYYDETMTASVKLASGYSGWSDPIEIPASVDLDGKTYTVTTIDSRGFRNSDTTAILLPETITTIGNRAFDGCSGLTSVVIPESVETLGTQAFLGCDNLETVYWNPVAMEVAGSSGQSPFYECYALKNVVIADGVTTVPANLLAFTGVENVVIPESVTAIGSYAFWGCEQLTSVNIPDGVTVISDHLFSDCYALTSVNIPAGVTTIGERAFSGCAALKSVDIPAGVTTIGTEAFASSGLASASIPYGATNFGEWVFAYCPDLTYAYLPKGMTEVPYGMFQGCAKLYTVVMHEGITNIWQEAFDGCSSLATIDLPAGLDYIAGDAFRGSGLTNITIPESVRSIENAFADCTRLHTITVNNYTGWIYGAPWGAPNATVVWTKG